MQCASVVVQYHTLPSQTFFEPVIAQIQLCHSLLQITVLALEAGHFIGVGLDHHSDISFQLREIGRYRNALLNQPDKYRIATNASDIRNAKSEGRLAVGLHFQGTNMLQGDLNLVEVYHQLGITHMLMAYNERNMVGDGCHEPANAGLSSFGHRLVAKMNEIGMIVDLTHTGERTALDATAASTRPVIYSHSSCRALFDHERNITDEQIQTCATTDGVVCVNGVGIFLSDCGTDVSAKTICRHIDHIVQLVGPRHVGIGLDYVANTDGLVQIVQTNKGRFADDSYDKPTFAFAGPEVIPHIAEELLSLNYTEEDIRTILGGNIMRVFDEIHTG